MEPGFAWPGLSPKHDPSEITLLWWNVNEGIANRYLEKEHGSPPLDQNLLALADSPHPPDILAFGEYNKNLLKKETLAKLKAAYPYSLDHYISYNAEGNAKGIMVFSKLPLTLKVQREMDYYPLLWNKEEGSGEKIGAFHKQWENDGTGAALYYKRCYLYFEVEKEGQTLAFVPTHIMEPMARILHDKNVSRWEKMLAEYDFVYDDDNPFYYQLEWLRSYLERDFGLNLDRQPLVIMGDFNMLRKYLWTTKAYKMISKGLLDPFEEEKDSWPVPSSRKHHVVKGMYQIDHAFYNKRVEIQTAEVLPLMGSDHFPLYIEAQIGAKG